MDFWILFLYFILSYMQAYQFPPITHPNLIIFNNNMAGWNKDTAYLKPALASPHGSLEMDPGEGQCNIIPEKFLFPGTEEHLRRISDFERNYLDIESYLK